MDAHKIVEEDIQTYIRKAMKAGIHTARFVILARQ